MKILSHVIVALVVVAIVAPSVFFVTRSIHDDSEIRRQLAGSQRIVEDQEKEINELEREIGELEREVEELRPEYITEMQNGLYRINADDVEDLIFFNLVAQSRREIMWTEMTVRSFIDSNIQNYDSELDLVNSNHSDFSLRINHLPANFEFDSMDQYWFERRVAAINNMAGFMYDGSGNLEQRFREVAKSENVTNFIQRNHLHNIDITVHDTFINLDPSSIGRWANIIHEDSEMFMLSPHMHWVAADMLRNAYHMQHDNGVLTKSFEFEFFVEESVRAEISRSLVRAQNHFIQMHILAGESLHVNGNMLRINQIEEDGALMNSWSNDMEALIFMKGAGDDTFKFVARTLHDTFNLANNSAISTNFPDGGQIKVALIRTNPFGGGVFPSVFVLGDLLVHHVPSGFSNIVEWVRV